jgi:hypothetical protein
MQDQIDLLFEDFLYKDSPDHIYRYPREYENKKGYACFEQLPVFLNSADPEKHFKHKTTLSFQENPIKVLTHDGRVLIYENHLELLDFYSDYKALNQYKLFDYLKGKRSSKKEESRLPFILVWYENSPTV